MIKSILWFLKTFQCVILTCCVFITSYTTEYYRFENENLRSDIRTYIEKLDDVQRELNELKIEKQLLTGFANGQ